MKQPEIKTRKVTEKEYIQIKRLNSIKKVDKQHFRTQEIKRNEMLVRAKTSEIRFKQDQLTKKESLETHDSFTDGKKPLFMLQAEIEQIKFEIDGTKEIIKHLKEEYEKTEKEE